MGTFFADNLFATIRELARLRGRAVDLNAVAGSAGGALHYCVAGLVAIAPHFQALGVERAPTGFPVMRGADGVLLSGSQTLAHLFGTFGACCAIDVLAATYGGGSWDAALKRWFPYPPSHKQLALARLHFALGVALGEAPTARPGPSAPPRIACALGLAPEPVSERLFTSNLDALEHAVLEIPEHRLCLGTWTDGAGGEPQFSPGGLVAVTLHFHEVGVFRDAGNGAPAMRGYDGEWLTPWQTLVRLFGLFEFDDPLDTLFAPYGEGLWDPYLLQQLPSDPHADEFTVSPSPKALVLARLQYARQFNRTLR